MSNRQALVTDMLASERYFTTGELLIALKGRGIDRGYVIQALAKLRKLGSLDEQPDPTHKLRKLYRLKQYIEERV